MARPRQFDEETVLDAAQREFQAHGYAGTSLQDLMRETGLGKGSLYAAFGDKHGLYLRVLAAYSRRRLTGTGDALDRGRAIDAIREHLLTIAHASTEGPSCLLTSSTAELAGVDADVRRQVEDTFAELEARYAAVVARAQAEGDVDAEADAAALGGLLLSVARGLETLGHAGLPEASLVRTVETALAALPPSSPRR